MKNIHPNDTPQTGAFPELTHTYTLKELADTVNREKVNILTGTRFPISICWDIENSWLALFDQNIPEVFPISERGAQQLSTLEGMMQVLKDAIHFHRDNDLSRSLQELLSAPVWRVSRDNDTYGCHRVITCSSWCVSSIDVAKNVPWSFEEKSGESWLEIMLDATEWIPLSMVYEQLPPETQTEG